MSWIWVVPAVLACVAVAVCVTALRALEAEAEKLRGAWRAVPALAQQSRIVRAEAARAEVARRATGDALARRAPH
jgi:hypothetical protein